MVDFLPERPLQGFDRRTVEGSTERDVINSGRVRLILHQAVRQIDQQAHVIVDLRQPGNIAQVKRQQIANTFDGSHRDRDLPIFAVSVLDRSHYHPLF